MSFEVTAKDLLGRIGRLRTKHGEIQTPILLPVVNPLLQPISPAEMNRDFGCKAIITNAYLMKKNFGDEVCIRGIHDFLGFDNVIMTDSGAYQILVYGNIETTQEEIISYQEAIDTDIGVILDIPTGGDAPREKAEYSVAETLRRARTAIDTFNRKDILWVGPVQGGNHLDLISMSAKEMGKLHFSIHALGSPTQVMEHYLFSNLVDMIMEAKRNLPVERPLHLFGAGHPFMFAFAVAMGCDLFDSAAYAIYAREGKYMMDYGTERLTNLKYLPCNCRICSKYTPQELCALETESRTEALARHNLNVCYTEIRRVKQAICEGRLWELLEIRARNHPSLLEALKNLGKHREYLEENTPIVHSRGFFYLGSTGLARPEIIRHRRKLTHLASVDGKVMILLPELGSKPFHRSKEFKRVKAALRKRLDLRLEDLAFSVFACPFGVTPLELDETFPLSQYETPSTPDDETRHDVTEEVLHFISDNARYCKSIVVYAAGGLGEEIARKIEENDLEGKIIVVKNERHIWSRKALTILTEKVMEAFSIQDSLNS
ncbi:tRNA guanosine(15) transglycosylase TgtA [Candidatus Bathyarchaeota archaeon]|nr:tRNA guanosine(15) transglycosylase TgtA [Candidatus Bathyarchaeota archaeon]